jgi:tetratricopeptide (TPR) repeat protein
MIDRHTHNFDGFDIDMVRRVDMICRRFEAEWRAGRQPRLEDYLGELPAEVRPALRAELEALEHELRHTEGPMLQSPAGAAGHFEPQMQPATIADAPTKSPGMPATVPITGVAIPADRTATTPPSLADLTIDQARSSNDQPAADGLEQSTPVISEPARVRYFGDYEIIREIARGGMGVVFLARQRTLNRPVALKMILAGQLADLDAVRRFYIEAEAAANLDHAGIVPIYEVGQHEGQHYFSMGFVEGQSLSQRLVEGPLPVRQAAELIRRVGEAIEYAHGHGVVHRDLKPANILLDQNGYPRITDFGLAKKVQGDSGLTGSGQIMGTPSYMPPEQARGMRGGVGPAADVYALGATLYALVTGRPPFQASTAMETILQVISDEPVPPRRLNVSVPRDLETICLKCLEKEPGKRYSSAAALGEDLRRYLAGEPITARPVGQVERAWRWCRRKPVVAGLVASLAAALLAGFVGITLGWLEARRQRSTAEENFRLARSAVDDYLTRVSESRVLRVPGLEPLRRELLEDALRYYRGFVERRANDPTVRKELMRAYERVGQINYLVGTDATALDAFRQSLRLAESLSTTSPGDAGITHQIAGLHNRIGLIEMKTGRTDEAFRSLDLARSIEEVLVRAHPHELAYQVDLAAHVYNLGIFLEATGRPAKGLQRLEQSLAVYERLAREHPDNDFYRYELAKTGRGIGNVLSDLGRTSEAMNGYRHSRAVLEGLVTAHPDDTGYSDNLAAVCNEIGVALSQNGQTAEAVASYRRALELREALARAHPAVTEYRRGVAHTLHQMGLAYVHGDQPADAVEPLRASGTLYEKLVKDHSENLDFRSSLGGTLNDLGVAQAAQGRHREAMQAFRAAIEYQSPAHTRAPLASTYTRFLANHNEGLGQAELNLGQTSSAIASFGRARELRDELVRAHPDVDQYRLEQAETERVTAGALRALNRADQAIASYTRARDILEAIVQNHPDNVVHRSALGAVLNDLGMALAATDCFQEAMKALEKAIEHQRLAHERAPGVPQYMRFLTNHYFNRGLVQQNLGNMAAARESLAAGLELREALALTHPEVAAFRSELTGFLDSFGMFNLRSGKPSEALGLLERACKLQEELSESRPDDPDSRMRLGGVLNDYGMALAALGRHPEAIEVFRAAVAQQRGALGQASGSGHSRRCLADHYWNLSQSLRALRRPADAAAAARECLAISSDNPDRLYDMACELSLCVPLAGADDRAGQAAQDRYAAWAIDALRKAIAAGFRDFAHMKVDTDLDPLRNRDDFQLLMMDFNFPANPLVKGL